MDEYSKQEQERQQMVDAIESQKNEIRDYKLQKIDIIHILEFINNKIIPISNTFKQRIIDLENKNQELEKQVELNNQKEKEYDSQMKKMIDDYNKINGKYKTLENELTNKNSEVVDLNSKYKQLNQLLQHQEADINKLNTKLKQLEEEKAELENQLKKNQEKETKEIQKGIAIGNRKTISFGNYKQWPNGEKKPIEWIVLDQKNGEALLLSKYILDCKPYNNIDKETSWKECTLNKWLNNNFYNEAFSKEEQENIIENIIETPDNPLYGTDGKESDYNHIFCLSIQEIEQYLINENEEYRKAKGSDYAKNKTNLYVSSYTSNSYWWTRSPGNVLSSAACVDFSGGVNMAGNFVDIDHNGVRPALWIKTKS